MAGELAQRCRAVQIELGIAAETRSRSDEENRAIGVYMQTPEFARRCTEQAPRILADIEQGRPVDVEKYAHRVGVPQIFLVKLVSAMIVRSGRPPERIQIRLAPKGVC